ncbi:putative helicase senataxin, P-loop containing nucleoside triphosphate hydrolase [Rosa chinensis]|uniref:Putative helicase senataxin, P-loop containing nucleoside triphosphate hydrolase n=2 Tax=Rosa chinensis TaxID=74649 RepID=A0A2P6RZL2_ROSCH|nr:uncharacterized protein LOC112187730 isoform X1 [Rosa chinensis]PRQ51867.1 putative helicase senataxin, P-loop containing nucleoside triphosphate hydrolase [Rosa chinensis]
MAKKLCTRRELLDRWRGIEEEADEDDDRIEPSKRHRLHKNKEQWFADTFNFLICLPKENHIWCGSWDLMGPLLETFYNYFNDEHSDSPLRQLWRRISEEMRQCIQCISQHYQTQEMYSTEYESSSIGPLLDVLRRLDEERVTQHLIEMNTTLARKEYDPARDNAEVVSVMYEVLMFPVLLDDGSLFIEFEKFIEAVDNMHELALAGQQQFPGVYALFFFKRRVRSVGHRLAGSMGKLRRAVDLEPLQPLLKKFIGMLETEVLPSTLNTSRARVQLDRTSIWIGVKTLLGFLEPPALEEGILERYPIFLDIVLNHISGDSSEFSHAVACLRKIFEMLGCKLWLRSTLAPGVMRDTLLGQCFHTRNEKSHKDIFDLFQPFLQSLEALQDGEHEKQRRHFLYFLLHQVTVSSNFSALTRQRACQISLLIVHRGYTMNPPCPPYECAHMWGPSLVSSLKDSLLHSSLRQPALDLIQTIIVSDAAALISSVLNTHPPLSSGKNLSFQLNDEDEDGAPLSLDTEEKDASSWSEFSLQGKITSRESREWMCIPMLWIDVLVDTNLSVLPISFSKAVFWARSRFSMVEPESSAEMALPVRTWLSSSATEIAPTFGWKVPTGSDDGGEGKESKNSIKVSTMPLPLVRMFNRLTAHFVVQVGQGELCKQWTWEPRMGESLFLSLIDPDDNVRQFGKCILEQVSNTRGLSCGLNFLCSHRSSVSAVFFGLRHAVKLVQLDTVVLNFQTLHHFFFVLRKLLNEGDIPESDHLKMARLSSQGGFLRQPVFDPPAVNVSGHPSNVDSKLLGRFCYLLSETAWPSICGCLLEGKAFINNSVCQMTCVRILEIIPCVFERLYFFSYKPSRISGTLANTCDFSWLHDIMDWGKSSLKVVVIYWQRTITSLLKLLKGTRNSAMASTINIIEKIISCDCVSMDELMEQVSLLSVSLSKEASSSIGKTNIQSKGLFPEGLSLEKKYSVPDVKNLSIEDPDVQVPHSSMEDNRKHSNNMIVLSDDETEVVLPSEAVLSDTKMSLCMMDDKTVASTVDKSTSYNDSVKKKLSGVDTSKALTAYQKIDATDATGLASQKQDSDRSIEKQQPVSLIKSKDVDNSRKEIIPDCNINDSFKFEGTVKSSDNAVSSKMLSQACNNMSLKEGGALLKQMVCDDEEDPLDSALNSVRRQQSFVPKPSISAPKRQLIQLQSPSQNRAGHLHRLEGRKRFQPPRLDEWYRPILELDYFALVGVASASENDKHKVAKLKEVPVNFQSPEQYTGIFCPLVLEEFKAQLHSSFLEMSSWEEVYFGSLSVLSVERIDDFHLVRFAHDVNDSIASSSFSENDLVLLTKEPPQKSSHDVHMLGKVERRERDNKRRLNILLIRFYLLSGTSRLHQARRNLLERSKWHASRVMNITSQLREFQALSLIKDIPLLPIILKPVNDSLDSSVSKEVDLSKLSLPLERILKSSFNDSQLQAISIATATPRWKKDFNLSLIQGPPGTGKTRTILAIVSALLASPPQKIDSEKKFLDSSSKRISVPKINQAAAIARAWQDAALARQLNEDVQRNTKSIESSMRGRVLICAQSNAAVDELVSRISSHGLYGSDGKTYKPYLVRVGNVKTVHPNSLPFFLDTIVDQRLADERMKLNDTKNDLSLESSITLRANLEKLVDRIRFYEAKRANLSDRNTDLKSSDDTCKEDDGKEMSDAEIAFKLRKLYEEKRQIYKDLSSVQQQEKKINEEIKGLRYKLRKSILREAEIVVTTLSGCGGDLYGVCSESMSSHKFSSPSEHTLFDAVVIDEAAQALEPATLIPLQLLKSTGTKCIMVGDPKQLPATVLSNVASKFLFECSMFERLQRAGHPVIMLTKQYRMHPDICLFPSMHFYEKKLLNGDDMSSKSAPFHETGGLGPYIFYDVIDGRELRGKNSSAMSLYNEHEADAAVELLKFLKKRYPSEFHGGRIGIITPYKSQLALLRSRFSSAFGSSIIDDMELNTVDGFQGREVDILILSTVRAAEPSSAAPGNNSSSIGFVADVRRMNVALTRAKLSLWILGNARTLQTNQNWAALVKDARKRNLVITTKMPYNYTFETALQKNSGNHLLESQRSQKIHDATQHAKRTDRSADEALDRRTKRMGPVPQSNRRLHGGEKDVSGTKEDVRSENVTAGEIHPLGHSKVSKDVGSAMPQKHVMDGESTDKESRKRKNSLENTQMGKRKVKFENSKRDADNSEQRGGDGLRPIKMQESKRAKKISEGDRSQTNQVSAPTNQMKDASDGGRASNQSGTSQDLIAKRKQQREAVDAILYSALIPSKSSKSETSMRPVPAKRPLSSSTAGGGIKPAKTRKD